MPDEGPLSAAARRRHAVVAGHLGDEQAARAGWSDPDPTVRAAALGALARLARLTPADVEHALADPSPEVRRRAAEEAVPLGSSPGLQRALEASLGDGDPLVVETTCWALGELAPASAVDPLAEVAASHPDSRCRETAVAALGALGARGLTGGLAAVLGALDDRPVVRRRAVVALAGFEGPEVEAALRRSLEDRDWQVRQAAEILLDH